MNKLLFSLIFLFIAVPHVYAVPASLSLEPVDIQTKQDQTFEVRVNMFTGDEAIASTDIMINYDKNLVEPLPQNIKNGDIFKKTEAKVILPGKLYLFGIQEDKNLFQPAQGTVAIINFKALKPGIAKLSFDCNPTVKNTSQIIKSNTELENIINCTSTITHTSQVSIHEGNVLGTSTQNFPINPYTILLGTLVASFSFIIFLKYQNMRKSIS
jgi:hypothetical protein